METQKLQNINPDGILKREEIDFIKETASKSLEKLKIEIDTRKELQELIEKDFGNYVKSLHGGNGKEKIKEIQRFFKLKATGEYNTETFKKVISFQRKFDLGVDGIAGSTFIKKMQEERKKGNTDKLDFVGKHSEQIINDFNSYSESIYNANRLIFKTRKSLIKSLNDFDNLDHNKNFIEGELNNIYLNHIYKLDTLLKENKNWLKYKLDDIVNNQRKDLEKLIDFEKGMYKDEANELINNIYNKIITFSKIFSSSYQTQDFEDNINKYLHEFNIDSGKSDIENIKNIIIKFKEQEIDNAESYIDILNKVGEIEDKKDYKKELEEEWNRKQSGKYETIIEGNFEKTIDDNLSVISILNKEQKNSIKEKAIFLGEQIKKSSNKLEALKIISKHYGLYVTVDIRRNLFATCNDLFRRFIQVEKVNELRRENYNLTKSPLKERLDKNTLAELQRPIRNTINKAKKWLSKEKIQILTKQIDEIYQKGINSANPKDFWNNYALIKKFDIKQPYYEHKNKNTLSSALDAALTIERIAIMQEDLQAMDFKTFENNVIKKIIPNYNVKHSTESKRIFIIKKLQNLYGLTGNVHEHLINLENEYGDIAEKVIKNTINRESQFDIGLLDIYGTKENAKELIFKIIIRESMGYIFTNNEGIRSSAIGPMQKVEDNYYRFKVNPFNPEQAIQSYIDNIIIAINVNISKEYLHKDNKLKIATLVHYIGEGDTERLLKETNGNLEISNLKWLAKITKSKKIKSLALKSIDFLDKIDNNDLRTKTFEYLGAIKIQKDETNIDKHIKKLHIERNNYSRSKLYNNYLSMR